MYYSSLLCILGYLGILLCTTPSSAGWPTSPPFWPHYPLRTSKGALQVLDGEWQYGYNLLKGDVTSKTIDTNALSLTNKATIPYSFDYVEPGHEGPRGTALYRTQVNITIGRKALINFAACSFYCNIYVDNVWIGDHRAGGFSPFWLSIPASTKMLRTIFVISDNRFNGTTAPIHTGGDFYHFGGIHRSVIVHELPEIVPYVERVEITPKNAQGLVDIDVVVNGSSANTSISISLIWDGVKPGSIVKALISNGVASLKSLQVPNAKPWAIGSPNLHTVYIGLQDFKGNVYDDIEARFGVRVVGKNAKSRITINGEVVKLVGHNRHTIFPEVGPSLTMAQIMQDIRLLKEMGSNYVRGAHYPQDQRFLDMCDEAGIVIWEEALGPSVTVKNTQDEYFMTYQKQQMNEMISASFNHPSVIFWGFFNEGPSDNTAACGGYQACADVAHARDMSRYVTWANNHGLSDKCLKSADVISFNAYPGWYDHPNDPDYVISYWNNLFETANKTYTQPYTVSECGCEGLYEWVNTSTTLWGQAYQNVITTNNVKTILANPRVSGIAIWVMCDFKGNDGAQSTCGACTYIAGTHNATNINVNCNGSCGLGCRPCGENHKGTLDFWRRKKQVFDIVQTLYHQQWP